MNKCILLLFCIAFVSFYCKRQKINLPPSPEVNNLTVQEIDFVYFSSRSKISYKDAENNLNAIANIRMKKDSLIWLSVSKIGVEGARCLITRDSIHVLNNLKNEYTAYNFASLSQRFNFTITFDFIQAAIVGNLPLSQMDNKAKFMRQKDLFLLRQQENAVTIENYIGTDNMKLKKLLMVEQPSNNSLTVNYDNFNTLNNALFPYNSLISLQYKSSEGQFNTEVTIQHQKVEISDNELKFPFNVPQKYDRK